MLIESLELDNFKSFGNKRKILFKKGFTVISGPNGSGKSNIGDSMLFVLGVRSSKTVRADRLTDLIHKASANQKQKNRASVTITINTEKMDVPEEERKIRITRELVSDEENYHSVYYINGARAKRSDVEHILDTLHIYLDSYSFVLQGDINNIVKMSGVERRKLLESIAGIESFDVQIEKAQKDIDGIIENLSRLEVMLEDSRRRIDQLSEEKENAEKYNNYNEKIKDLRSTLMTYELGSIVRDMDSVMKQVGDLSIEIGSLKGHNQQIVLEIDEKKAEKKKVEAQRDAVGSRELIELRKKMEDLRIEIAQYKMKVEDAKESIREITHDADDQKEQVGEFLELITSKESKLKENNIQLENIGREADSVFAELSEMRRANESSSKAARDLQDKLKKLDSETNGLRAELDTSVDARSRLESQRSSRTNELATQEERKREIEFQIKDAQWRLKDMDSKDNERKTYFEDLNKRYYKAKGKLDSLQKKKDALQDEISKVGREYDSLQMSSKGSRSVTHKALNAIMNARNQSEIKGIHGPIRELIRFDDEYKNAIDATAGGRLNAVVVDDDAVAQQCLELLKREKIGKLTFLPLNKITSGRPRGKAIIVQKSEGSLGYVFERVEFDKKYDAAMWYAFQDTVIVNNVQTARKYMVGVRLVTLDGDIFEASGAITGGYSQKTQSSIDIEARLSQASTRLKELSDGMSEVKTDIEDTRALLDSLTEELKEKSREEGSKSTLSSNLQQVVEDSRGNLSSVGERIKSLTAEVSDLAGRISAQDDIINGLNASIGRNEEEKNAIYEKLKQLSPEAIEKQNNLELEYNSLKNQAQQVSSENSTIESEIRFTKEKISEAEKRIKNYGEKLISLGEQITANGNLEKEQTAVLEKYRIMEEQMDARSREFTEKINKLENTIDDLMARLDSNKSAISTKNEIIITLNARMENLTNKKESLEEEIQKIGGKPIEEKMSVSVIKVHITNLEKMINDLGPINHRAIEEYNIVKEEFSRIDAEKTKLESEKKELEELTARLNEQKKTVFLKLYHGINQDMNEIYYTLSGGGEAQLLLSDENDPMNAEVSIRARPKGSNFSKLDSLSGGEKSLTALSFIMAVQRTNPSPVYYLDEVDMFLDGANVERIGKMFRANSQTSQILVVSLRKAMLKYSDHIIGVTSFDDENTEVFEKTIDQELEVF